MKTPGALPLVVLPVLASALHLDQVLNQVQGASKALRDLVHWATQSFLSQTLNLEQDRFRARQIRSRSGELIHVSRL